MKKMNKKSAKDRVELAEKLLKSGKITTGKQYYDVLKTGKFISTGND